MRNHKVTHASEFMSCVTSDKRLNLSVPLFSYLENVDNYANHLTGRIECMNT